MAKKGIILFNIGTPRSYEVNDVKQYLLKFLMDKDIIDLPFLLRWFLVHGIIVPRRAAFSAGNYKKIWLADGSPLLVYSQAFTNQLQHNLGENYSVKLAMRYSEPSTETALKELQAEGVDSITLIPMFPQYAEATTGSILKEFTKIQNKIGLNLPINIIKYFYKLDSFIANSARIAADSLRDQKIDHYLFSFHGLPESHVKKNKGCLTNKNCCFEASACEKPCYQAQCHASAEAIAQKLNLSRDQWSVSFQSRLGRGEWLKPSTEVTLEHLAKNQKSKVAVLCPSFVTDCIETLEEIAIGGKEHFLNAGGEDFYMIPCLNADDQWVTDFAGFIKKENS